MPGGVGEGRASVQHESPSRSGVSRLSCPPVPVRSPVYSPRSLSLICMYALQMDIHSNRISCFRYSVLPTDGDNGDGVHGGGEDDDDYRDDEHDEFEHDGDDGGRSSGSRSGSRGSGADIDR
eukprot:GHVU01225355.1.p1 GENE.GHVU01225355.1~~GHVU01225355.1.p1  ORF type:complete len:122 (-),score=9.70 GHVU01225355.1:349-714(-)